MVKLTSSRTRRHASNVVGSISGEKVVVAENVGQLFVGQWKRTERDVASRVVVRLEDCRALFNDFELEVPSHGVTSISKLREFLTDEIQSLNGEGLLAKQLRAMRAACRKFLDNSVPSGHLEIMRPLDVFKGGVETWRFCVALGELRASCGLALALMMNAYGLDCESELARILPADLSDKT
jgi:hypothetical protein